MENIKIILIIFITLFSVVGICSCESNIPEGCIQCPYCKGEGRLNKCKKCKGLGFVYCPSHMGLDCFKCSGTNRIACDECRGYDYSFQCPMCLGSGYIKE